ncbi:MAG: hypothetical protein F6K42_12580 [Leptolyngbya sp. SIO1D8]|nr:hypothetical protein [Leptolyngbya sp. SIO1D8]
MKWTSGEVPSDVIAFFEGCTDFEAAISFHRHVEAGLARLGYEVHREFEVPDRGDGRRGKVDLVIIREDCWIGIELDNQSAREKSIQKLESLKNARGCLIAVRNTESSTNISVTPENESKRSGEQLKGSEGTKFSGAKSQSKKVKTKKRTADDINRDLETREPAKFASWWQWYREKVCAPYGAIHGDRAAAADEWIKLVDAGVDLQRVSSGSAEYLRQLRSKPDPVGIPHGSNFLKGSKQHPTPYWESALRDSEPEQVIDSDFMPSVEGERVAPMRRSRYGIDQAALIERLQEKYGQKEAANA